MNYGGGILNELSMDIHDIRVGKYAIADYVFSIWYIYVNWGL